MRNISNFERKLYLATENNLDDFETITIRDGYSTVTYTRNDIVAIGEIVIEEQYMDWLMSQGEDAYNAEIERQKQEREEYERYVAEQCELAEKQRGGNNNDAA